MAGIADLVPDPRGRDDGLPNVRETVVVSTPADTTERVFVRDDLDQIHGPCPWIPRIVDASHYGIPEEGDFALLAFNEEDEPVIVNWWDHDA